MKLSVLLMTYNHGPFVGQAVRSVLDQRTGFPFEVVVAEDCSTDDTGRLVSQFEAQHPGRVRVLRRGRNLGIQANFIDAYSQCRGDYVATLDGDDYWTAADKLQRQVEFLDRNPTYSFCFHNVKAASATPGEDGQEVGATAEGREGRTAFELEDLVKGNFVPFGSVVARNRLIPEFAKWVRDIPGIDWIFGMLNARRGPFARIDGCLGVYRKHAGGAWTSLSFARQINTVLKIYEGIRDDLPSRLCPLVDTMILNIKLRSEWHLAREKVNELMRSQYGEEYQRLVARNTELEAYARELAGKYVDLERYTKDLVDKYGALETVARDLDTNGRDLAGKFTQLETYTRDRDRYCRELVDKFTGLEAYTRDRDRYCRELVDKFTGLENYTRDLQDRFATLEATARSHGLDVPKARVAAPRPAGRGRRIRSAVAKLLSTPVARIRGRKTH
jgi:glycosyltransferase involved in cell wall biosynthesis